MRKLWFLCVIAAAATSALAQEDFGPPANAATLKYDQYRHMATEPSYGLKKVKSLIAKIKRNSDDNLPLDDKLYQSLTFEEKFTYTMLHAEEFSQNCSAMPVFAESEKKIFAFPAAPFGDEAVWSPRQRDWLKKNRTKVIGLLRTTITQKQRIGVNLKTAILELNAVELIPDMVKIYNRDHKDQDILTVLMILMKENKYEPFMKSLSYKKLYADEASSYKSFLMANPANQKLTADRAMSFYKLRKA